MYILFYDTAFPGCLPALDVCRVLGHATGTRATADTLAAVLDAAAPANTHTLVMLHGAYFPEAAWPSILRFLQRGGNLIAAGGPVFSRPVAQRQPIVCAGGGNRNETDTGAERWVVAPRTWAYCRALRLGPFSAVDLAGCEGEHPVPRKAGDKDASPLGNHALTPTEEASFLREHLHRTTGQPFWPLSPDDCYWAPTPQLSESKVYADEEGSTGTKDTLLLPLAHVHPIAADGRPDKSRRLATPLLLLDQANGTFSGGRWLLMPWQPAVQHSSAYATFLDLLGACFPLVNAGYTQSTLQSEFATYMENDKVALRLVVYRPRGENAHNQHGDALSRKTADVAVHWSIAITVHAPNGALFHSKKLEVAINPGATYSLLIVPGTPETPGLYTMTLYQRMCNTPEVSLLQYNGFLVRSGQHITGKVPPLRPGLHLFHDSSSCPDDQSTMARPQRPRYMFGTTYMDSRVQRHYLLEPNPWRWSRDMAEMRAVGINVIRTGLWCGWSEWMTKRREALLRALDAFILIACQHRLQVIFSVFAFTPAPAGKHPFLDPKSIVAQQAFLALLCSRYAKVPSVHWDLINEPSFGGPQRLWDSRAQPNGDVYEAAAFRDWLRRRYHTLERVRTRWRCTVSEIASWSDLKVPTEADYSDAVGNTNFRHMLRAADFTRASQHWFRDWAARMATIVTGRSHRIGHMVTVGQDEGAERPLPLYHASSVDFTCTHPWWNNDDLLWDHLMARTRGKPAVAAEVGMMLARDVSGDQLRSDSDNAMLLARKLYIALSVGGVIQWLWHTNAYMVSDNECQIGLVRSDGSEKAELGVFREFGRLMHALKDRWLDEAPGIPYGGDGDSIWLMVPDSQWFARPALTRGAVRTAVRVLGYRFGLLPQLITEEELPELAAMRARPPRHLFAPSVQLLSHAAFEALLMLAQRGTHICLTGVLQRDEDGLLVQDRVTRLYAQLQQDATAQADASECDSTSSSYEDLGSARILEATTLQATLDAIQDAAGIPAETASVRSVTQYEPVLGVMARFGGEKMGMVHKSTSLPLLAGACGHAGGRFTWLGVPVELADDASATAALYAKVLDTCPRKDSGMLLFSRRLRDGWLFTAINESSAVASIPLLATKPGNSGSTEASITLAMPPGEAGAVVVDDEGTNSTCSGISTEPSSMVTHTFGRARLAGAGEGWELIV
ncbi:hypothetical protein THASP1DRAFT_32048 [Thamnocephalis sphaerospora]|uniref:Glycoside hydrolase family 42 N-terminal domain-containing protein n=1 Tax=Thamnocephalis sphaerospora TaxID=78915 RepID=A0A4P9XK59_9FUNG|nr:hypothetical protein THASP1DRAFT_32048 [Thamnocephalis sphaerospora]|eukprot:RKP06126.1 hypothetical protein THASP1DRAFT_32048 [Thamnocephalis sphaerospora]